MMGVAAIGLCFSACIQMNDDTGDNIENARGTKITFSAGEGHFFG